jgi:hypothetical protein
MSGDQEIPARVRELIQSSIRSTEQLEILFRLRADASRSWSTKELARDLRMREAVAASAAQGLALGGLISGVEKSSPLRYRYDPRGVETVETLNALAEAHAQNQGAILMLISSGAIGRMRKHVLRAFNAPLRGGKRDDDR